MASLLSLSRTVSLVTEARFCLRLMESIFRGAAVVLQRGRAQGVISVRVGRVVVVMAVV